MERLSEKEVREEIIRIRPLLLEDDRRRNRSQFVHSFDILSKNWAAPYSIWPIPNSDALKVIEGRVDCNDLPFEHQNEVEKGMLFEELRQFIAQNLPREMLCEARNYLPCLEEKCPLFRPKNTKVGGQHGLCSEFKIAFQRK